VGGEENYRIQRLEVGGGGKEGYRINGSRQEDAGREEGREAGCYRSRLDMEGCNSPWYTEQQNDEED